MGEQVTRAPVVSEEGLKRRDIPLFTRLEQGAQALLDRPGDITNIMKSFRGDLCSQYGFRETSYKLDKFSHLISKEAFLHLGGERFIEQGLPLLTSDTSPVVRALADNPDRSKKRVFYQVLNGLWLGAVNSVKEEIKSDPKHPYRSLWDYAKSSYEPFRKGVERYEKARILDEEFESHLDQSLVENTGAAYMCMNAIKRDIGKDSDPATLTKTTLANLDTIGWLATIDGDTFSVLARHAASRALSPRVNNFTGDETLFAITDGRIKIVHPVFGEQLNGPKSPPAGCTGLYSLATPNSPHGKFDNVSLILKAGTHLAKQTVFTR